MLAIPNTTLLDPTAAGGGWQQWAGADVLAGGFIVVANNPAEVQVGVGQQGAVLPQWGSSMYLPPGTYPLAAGARQPVAGIRARNYVAGSNSQFFGSLYYPGEAQLLAGSQFDSVVAAGGGVTPPGSGRMITGAVTAAGNVQAGTGFTVNRTGVGVYVVTFTTGFAATPIVLATALDVVRIADVNGQSASGFTGRLYTNAAAAVDSDWNFVAFAVA